MLLSKLCGRHAQMLLDKLAEEREIGEIKFGANFLDGLVAVAKLLSDGVDCRLMDMIERRAA